MVAKFRNLAGTSLEVNIEKLLIGIVCNSDNKGNIDAESLSDILDEFAGKDYMLWLKLQNDVPLSPSDREYLSLLLDKHEQDTV